MMFSMKKRYFWSGDNFDPIDLDGFKIGLAICEDLWNEEYTINPAEEIISARGRINFKHQRFAVYYWQTADSRAIGYR